MSARSRVSRRAFLTGAFRAPEADSGSWRAPAPPPAPAPLNRILEDLNDLDGIWEAGEPTRRGRSNVTKTVGLWALTFTLAASALPAMAGELTPEADDGLDVWFRSEAIEALSVQDRATYIETPAGESKLLERAFPDAPPQVSHSQEDMLPITADDNECIECHHPDNVTGKEDLPLPESHFERAIMKPGKKGDPMAWVVAGYEKGDDVAGARYTCTMCHVPKATNVKTPASSFVRVEAPEGE